MTFRCSFGPARGATRRLHVLTGVLALLAALPACAAAAAAEIVLLVGKGEHRPPAGADWQPAFVKQQLAGGAFVRTLANSQMALLMADRTQVRLNQNSQLQIKSVAETGEWKESTVRLNSGRAWSQARPQTAPSGAKSTTLTMETPSATMSIRGTDWEVEVGPDGSTQLVVLSGRVLIGNAHGALEVGSGEAATAAPDKAPVRLMLVNPASRVQWVSSWRPQPARWLGGGAPRHAEAIRRIDAGDYATALDTLQAAAATDAEAAILAADLLVFSGDAEAAAALLLPHAGAGAGDVRAVVLLARIWTRLDRPAAAQELLVAAQRHAPGHAGLHLARGELAIVEGLSAEARQAFAAALAADPDSVEAWYGLGRVESERENIRAARQLLGEALARDGRHREARAELAAGEALAGNLAAAEATLDSLLAHDPQDYAALTVRGLTRIKQGRAAAALEDFLKAGLVEPRYARAWLYSGVAFHQLGERERALQAFRKAAELDARDPLPHMLTSMVEGDALEFGAAAAAAHAAQERMPYLKSLNQLANNQRGSANLGSALASLGLEQWASYYAAEAYSPYWGGSHLFSADRHTGQFAKNSELFKGFITEPTAFGTSNRSAGLIAAPGRYGRVDLLLDRGAWSQGALIGTVNGLSVDPVPLAYFASGDLTRADSRHDASTARGDNLTLGLGLRPRHDIGMFGFANAANIDGRLRTASLTDDRLDQRGSRGDLGINFKRAPDDQFWLKGGSGSQHTTVDGPFLSQASADALNAIFNTSTFLPAGTLDRYATRTDQDDFQFRHAFAAGGLEWTWGAEASHQRSQGRMITTFSPIRLDTDQSLTLDSTDVYLSVGLPRHETWSGQLDLFAQRAQLRRTEATTLTLLAAPPVAAVLTNTAEEHVFAQVNPRLGLKWSPTPRHVLRLVGQKWRRPAAVGTLGPIDTLGVAVNDSLPTPGGLYERARAQYDAEAGGKGFFQAFVDFEWIDNDLAGRRSAITDFQLTQLQELRNRPETFAPRPDIEETPIFVAGSVKSLGLAANVLVDRHQALSARYQRRQGRQTGANAGLAIPYLPRDFLQFASRWSLPERWLLGVDATYRSRRYRDDVNIDGIGGGWSFGCHAYWETADKRSSVQAILDNLLPDKTAGALPHARFVLRYTARF